MIDREEFKKLRALSSKVIVGDIKLASTPETEPLLIAPKVPVMSNGHVVGHLLFRFNPETGAKTVNAYIEGVGPICRLDVDGPPHRPLGGSHKHELCSKDCPDENLRRCVLDMSHLSGEPPEKVFSEFFTMANIYHDGCLQVGGA